MEPIWKNKYDIGISTYKLYTKRYTFEKCSHQLVTLLFDYYYF